MRTSMYCTPSIYIEHRIAIAPYQLYTVGLTSNFCYLSSLSVDEKVDEIPWNKVKDEHLTINYFTPSGFQLVFLSYT